MLRCPNCHTINPPEAKYCLECGNRLVVCPNCGTVNLPIAKFCIECGTALTSRGENTAPLSQDTQEARGTLQIPSNGDVQQSSQSAFQFPRTSVPPEERRVVTVMFADIVSSTPLAEHLDPEDMRAILAAYFNLMTEQIRRHGGTVEKYIGDAVMAVFGTPVAHEDDPDRAIRAALDMQTALANFNAQRQERDPQATHLQMRIGINTGEVVGQGGGTLSGGQVAARQDFLITGDPVNVAARLQQVAAPDTILVGERTYLTTRDVFDFRRIAPLHLRGKSEPILAWVVQGYRTRESWANSSLATRGTIAQHPRGIEGLEARLVGRTLELTLMHATYARVQTERHPHLITLLGVPGIGKSRLVHEFIEGEQEKASCTSSDGKSVEPRVLQGRCPPYGEGITYWPLIEILRSLLNVRDGDTYNTIKARLVDLVRDTLISAKRTEDPTEIASAIARSIGRELDVTPLAFDRADQATRLPASLSAFQTASIDGSPALGVQMATPEEVESYVDGRERERQRSTHSKSTEQSGQQAALFRAWRIFLEALAQQQPLILVIDDLQWADEALLDLLEYLTDRVTNVPILFLCPARPDFFERRREWGGGRRNFTTIALESLSNEESNELINELLKTDELPDALRHTILNRAEGNPFFVEEIVRMLIDQGVLVNGGGSWHVSAQYETILSELASPAAPPEDTLLDQHYVFPLPRVPDTIQGVLAARIDLLSLAEKRILQDASIIGRTFWLSGLLELAADPEATLEITRSSVLQTLDSLMQRDFIIETDKPARSPLENDRVFSFKHVLIRDVVYNNIPRARRAQAHAELALWLEERTAGRAEQFVELLAYHYQQALENWSANLEMPLQLPFSRAELRNRAIHYLTMAGDQALRSYYTIRAIQAYSEALDLLGDSNADGLTLGRMHDKLGDAYAQRANLDEAWEEYRQALQLIREAPESEMEEPAAKNETLLCLYERLAELPTRWGGWWNAEPDLEEVRSYIDAGLKLLEDHHADFSEAQSSVSQSPETTANVPVSSIGKIDVNRDRVAFLTYQALWYLRQMDQPEIGSTERAALAEQALRSGNEAMNIAEEKNDAISLWIALDALGFIYLRLHKYHESHSVQHRRLELVSAISSREELHDLYYSLGSAHERVSDYPSALKWFGRASHIAQNMESPSMLLVSMIGRMYVWYHWNRWDEVREVARNILQMCEQYQLDEQWQFDALETLAEIDYRTGNEEEGDQYMRQCRRLIDLRGIQPELTRSIHLARQDWTRALADYRTSVERSEPFPRPIVLAILAELSVMMNESTEVQQTLCERAVSHAHASGSRKAEAVALRARGRMYIELQNWEAAEQDLKQSLAQCEMLDLPWERGNTLFCLGSLYRHHAEILYTDDSAGRDADLGLARFYLEQALGFYESLGAVNDAEQARLALAQESMPPA